MGRDATVSEVIEHSLTTERLENGAAAATATAAGITSEAIPAAETAEPGDSEAVIESMESSGATGQ